mmetsp:Transcript_10681/g.16045  ORF Transcript_10681/g.16045 Transcript_10681/m.16045 type:complete len:106 (+) Transcript_10681:6223-6540(+)
MEPLFSRNGAQFLLLALSVAKQQMSNAFHVLKHFARTVSLHFIVGVGENLINRSKYLDVINANASMLREIVTVAPWRSRRQVCFVMFALQGIIVHVQEESINSVI